MMQISQGHLNTLEYCPRLFQHLYLDQLSAPPTSDQQEAMVRGSRFHILMQQRELGLSTAMVGEDAALNELVDQFLGMAPDVLRRDRVQFRQSEHRRQLILQGFLLTVVYDLLILEPEQAEILDWKTSLVLPSAETLERHWQWKLYPFVLTETSPYEPEQIKMSYWFVQVRDQGQLPTPQVRQFSYSHAKHETIYQELMKLLAQLTEYLQTYAAGRSLPQTPEINSHCAICPFKARCQRQQNSPALEPPLVNLRDIQEIAI